MKLTALTDSLPHALLQGTKDKDVETLIYFSDEAVPGSMFFAIPGTEKNGLAYADDAVKRGASVIVVQEFWQPQSAEELEKIQTSTGKEITVLLVEDVRKALAHASCLFYGNPCRELLTVGITGTKGKTSTSYMLRAILEEAGFKSGLIGTVENGWESNFQEADRTTPQSSDVQCWCRKMADGGCSAVVMEVSSQGLMQSRVRGVDFDIGIFTNLSPDHIGPGEHRDFTEYAYWKSTLFQQCRVAVINEEVPAWRRLLETVPPEHYPQTVLSFGDVENADFRCVNRRLIKSKQGPGVCFTMEGQEIVLGLPGYFNVENAAAAIVAARSLGISWTVISSALAGVQVPGRVEPIDTGGRTNVLVDYAHNGVALKHLLTDLRLYQPARLILVFGCGGNRDRNRRTEMGRVAAELADMTIVTSDNPRNEPPQAIIRDITDAMDEAGAEGRYRMIPDRAEAIRQAVLLGEKDDIVLIAGKGHESYQLTGGHKIHFDDREIVRNIIGGLPLDTGLRNMKYKRSWGNVSMRKITVKEITEQTGGTLLQGSLEGYIRGTSIDSRDVTAENGFFPMKGARVDGHDFLEGVLQRGCRTLVVSDAAKVPGEEILTEMGLKFDDVNVILVDDTLKALQKLAKYYIAQLPLKKKIAVTGSVGKTSTRDMLYYVASMKYKTGRNQKNYNNEFGLPLTILSFDEELEVAVLEMGMDNFGEIDLLADMVRPDIAVITNVGISHIENLGSREGIRKAKMEVTNYFGPESVLVVNQSCDLLQKEMVSGDYQVVTVGNDGKSDFIVSNVCDFGDKGIKYTLDRNHKQYEVSLPVPGAHNATNASLAVAVGELLGIDLETAIEGLKQAELTAKRLNIRGKGGIKVIDDTYNAAPESMRSAINTLLATKGLRKVAILSDMRELGPESERFHREIGAYAGEHKIDFLITVGNDARYIGEGAVSALGRDKVKHYDTKEVFLKEMEQYIRPGDVVLVKGSRSMEMEKVVKKIFEDKE